MNSNTKELVDKKLMQLFIYVRLAIGAQECTEKEMYEYIEERAKHWQKEINEMKEKDFVLLAMMNVFDLMRGEEC